MSRELRDSLINGETPDRKDYTVSQDLPWIYANEVYHFDLQSIGVFFQRLYRELMKEKNFSYDKAVDYVENNSILKTGTLEGREVFVIANDENFEEKIVGSVQEFTREPGYYTPPGGGDYV